MVDVVTGIYQGRSYVARLTERGVWVVRTDGPVIVFPALTGQHAMAVREEVERLFDALLSPVPQHPDTACIGPCRERVFADPTAVGAAANHKA